MACAAPCARTTPATALQRCTCAAFPTLGYQHGLVIAESAGSDTFFVMSHSVPVCKVQVEYTDSPLCALPTSFTAIGVTT